MPDLVHAVVLLEGASDVAAVRSAARVRGVDLNRTELVNLGGVTNVRKAMHQARQQWPAAHLLGMCDAAEARFVERALHETGHPVRDASDLPAYGFFVCRADLEDELIRALGPSATIRVLEGIGLTAKWAALQQQPAWQGRPVVDQLHRFCGVASGRKQWLAGELAAALGPEAVPEPLALLLDRIAVA